MRGGVLSASQGAPLIELAGITKRFGGVVALNQVDLQLAPGEIVGLVGDNGAGKSTLIKVMAGAYQPDGGTIRFEGREVALNTPRAAKELGISRTTLWRKMKKYGMTREREDDVAPPSEAPYRERPQGRSEQAGEF